MDQKYKFFIKQNAVIFRQNAEFQENNSQLTKYWIDRLIRQDLEEDIVVEVSDLRSFIAQVKSSLLFIKAGGGYVLNKRNELLMIFRRSYWDLPKGKLDAGETIEECAVREVQEECGISRLTITSGPFSTFHLYEERGKTVVKESIWFEMMCADEGELIPQTEEDIAEARWVSFPIPMELRSGAYESIREVLKHFA
jgi:8-oxo-dGTP pyrophosphatase MutT (NUDIX family)